MAVNISRQGGVFCPNCQMNEPTYITAPQKRKRPRPGALRITQIPAADTTLKQHVSPDLQVSPTVGCDHRFAYGFRVVLPKSCSTDPIACLRTISVQPPRSRGYLCAGAATLRENGSPATANAKPWTNRQQCHRMMTTCTMGISHVTSAL